jgi:exopolysaccharide biosynthesis polyprenyl glycosylphosphotransferase
MLRSNAIFFRRIVMVLDAVFILLAFYLSFRLLQAGAIGTPHRLFFLGSLPVWIFVLHWMGAYESLRQRSYKRIFLMSCKSAALFSVLQLAALYLLGWDDFPRMTMLLFAALAGTFVGAMRLVVMATLARVRRYGLNSRNVLIVGTDAAAVEYARLVRAQLDWGLQVCGFLRHDGESDSSPYRNIPVLGHVDELAKFVVETPADQVVFSVPSDGRMDRYSELLGFCREVGVEVIFLPQMALMPGAAVHVEDFFGMPVVHYNRTPQQIGGLLLKQMMDSVLSALALILLLPLFVLIATAIKLNSPGPVFFRQARAGLHGRTFRCYKFRTMFVDAEARLAELKHLNEMSGPVFKMRNDPRITGVGRFLRKYSLDELPQFINVFVGDMSLVGPRPPLPAEVAQYTYTQRRRLSIKPGITCIWQVSGRNNIDFDNWVRLDLEYIDKWSLILDIKLLLKTVQTVMRGTGV